MNTATNIRTTSEHQVRGWETASDESRVVRTDSECQAEASEFFATLTGSTIADLRWDDTHHLRGHGCFLGCQFVVIAPRDNRHHTVVLAADDWNVVRVAEADQRCDLLDTFAVADRSQLVEALRRHQ